LHKEIGLYTASKINSEFSWFDIDGDIDPLFKVVPKSFPHGTNLLVAISTNFGWKFVGCGCFSISCWGDG
jgi:hypothetical protein